ncbi:MAG: histidine--tRNA ligase [Gammaproteobacteria bacterium]
MTKPKPIQAVRGMADILPADAVLWQQLEDTARRVLISYGYQEIRLPLIEQTELFSRSIGEVTDIVEKEMYTFADRNRSSLTLRPEGTAGCVRAAIEHNLLRGASQRLWYMGPMFRHERPQKGRHRQFHQLGIEAFGMAGPVIDAEQIFMGTRLWNALGVQQQITLEINSLGSVESRTAYRERLVDYFSAHTDDLDADSRRRLTTNPLRILDSKAAPMQPVIREAPSILDHLDDESAAHFREFEDILKTAGIAYRVNPCLVRGLDYYTKTVFEWVTDCLGSQGTVCAGGRYDGLVAQIGGPATPAIGFAIGLDRLIALMKAATFSSPDTSPHAYLVAVSKVAMRPAATLAETLRERLPHLRLLVDAEEGSFKGKLRRADRSGARLALILGESEAQTNQVAVKDLRNPAPQRLLSQSELARHLEEVLFSAN